MTDRRRLSKVFTGSLIEVEFMKTQLEDAGIDCLVQDVFLEGIHAGLPIGTPNSVELYVEEEDQEKAEQIVRDLS